MTDYSLAIPADDRELGQVLDIVGQALHFPREMGERFAGIVGREHFRALRKGSDIVGGLCFHEMGQFFGGRSVPMSGVGAVGIATEHRAGGAATAMMRLALRDMRDRADGPKPISSLYPATVPLYRRAGFELAGARYEITIPIREMHLGSDLAKNIDGMRIERVTEADDAAIRALYFERARDTPGQLDRRVFSWRRVYEPRGEKAAGYKAVNASGEMEGYLFMMQKDGSAPTSQNAAHAPLLHLLVGDVQFTTPAAGLRLLELLRQHKSVCDAAMMYGSPDHPFLALIPERTFIARHQFHWMLRIIDVEGAVRARGWNSLVRGEVHLDVRDDGLPENNAKFTLAVADGAADVRRGGRGDAIIDVRGLAALYSGHLSPQDLVSWGRLRIADHVKDPPRVLDTLSGLFAGPRPWLGDMF